MILVLQSIAMSGGCAAFLELKTKYWKGRKNETGSNKGTGHDENRRFDL